MGHALSCPVAARVATRATSLARTPRHFIPRMPLQPPATLWTIGHSTHPIDEFLDFLDAHGITPRRRVRRFPGSRAHPQFNPEPLGAALAARGISYTPMPQLGGRRTPRRDTPHTAWRNESFRGYADYMDTPEFAAAAEELAALARKDQTFAACAPRPCGGAVIAP